MTSLLKAILRMDASRQSLKWSRKAPLKKGDMILVSDYSSNQDTGELIPFRVTKICKLRSHYIPNIMECKVIGRSFKTAGRVHLFTPYCSPDVLSARVIATYPELFKYRLKALLYRVRRYLARRLFPEGF